MTGQQEWNDLADALAPGATVGDFTIERLLGQGGFGITYVALDRVFDRKVAIKEFLPTDLARRVSGQKIAPRAANQREAFETGLAEFVREARMLDRLEHRNVVRVRSFFNQNDTAYLVMEYVEGPTLAQLLPDGQTLGCDDLDAFLAPLLDGLAHVHSRRYLHRDIKPENIILRGGRLADPVLIDFGAARESVGARSRSIAALVSAGYTPLEQYSSNLALAPASDIYAVAAVAYRCLSGAAPPPATERAIEDSALQSFGTLVGRARPADYPGALDAALALRLAERPATVDELLARLYPERAASNPASPAEPADVGLAGAGGAGVAAGARSTDRAAATAALDDGGSMTLPEPGPRSAGAMRDRNTRTMRVDFIEPAPPPERANLTGAIAASPSSESDQGPATGRSGRNDPVTTAIAPLAAGLAGAGQSSATLIAGASSRTASISASASALAFAPTSTSAAAAASSSTSFSTASATLPVTPMLVAFLAFLSALPFVARAPDMLTPTVLGHAVLGFPLAAWLGTGIVRRLAPAAWQGGLGSRAGLFVAAYLLISVLSTLFLGWPAALEDLVGGGDAPLSSALAGLRIGYLSMFSMAAYEFALFAALFAWVVFVPRAAGSRWLDWLCAFPKHNRLAMAVVAAGVVILTLRDFLQR